MSKVVFIALITCLSAPNLVFSEEKDPCEAGMLALNHWAAQLEQDTSTTHSIGECEKEATVGKQSFPKLLPHCSKLKFSDLPENTQHYWLNHLPKGIAKPTPNVLLGSFSETFGLDLDFHIEESCKRLFPQ